MFLLLSGNCFLKSGTIEGKRILIAGLKICFTGVFNLNYKEGFEKENQIYKVYNIYNK